MKRILYGVAAVILGLFCLLPFSNTYAQDQNKISITSQTLTQGDKTVLQVTVSASAAQAIQGIVFKLNFDPACLQPAGFQSMVLNLNNTSMPQQTGVVDGIFTSTEPLTANGGMVNVNFSPLKACSTQINLLSASLVVLNSDGIAVPLEGVSVDTSPVSAAFTADQVSGAAVPTQSMSVLDNPSLPESEGLPLAATATLSAEEADPNANTVSGSPSSIEKLIVVGAGILVLFAGILIAIVVLILRSRRADTGGNPHRVKPLKAKSGNPASSVAPVVPNAPSVFQPELERYLSIRRGIQAGTRIKVENFPFALGYSPANDLRLEDPSISAFHAKLFLKEDVVLLVDLGNPMGTNVNGHIIRNQKIELKNGDVIKIGAIVLAFSQL